MFGWFRRNIKRVDVLGVGVEFHPPPADPTPERKPATADAASPLPLPSATIPATVPAPDDLLARDCEAFLATIKKECGQKKRDAYERVLKVLVDWSVARSGKLEFREKKSKAEKPQATVSFYVRGGPLFWEIYPDETRKDAKFCCLSSVKAPEELKKEAREGLVKVSPRGAADPRGKSAPTISFDDLVSDDARGELVRLLDNLLARLAPD